MSPIEQLMIDLVQKATDAAAKAGVDAGYRLAIDHVAQLLGEDHPAVQHMRSTAAKVTAADALAKAAAK